MILRLSQKLNTRIKGGILSVLPLHDKPLLDWSAQAFVVMRKPYVLLSNTKSLFSTLLEGTYVSNVDRFTEVALGGIRMTLEGAGCGDVYRRVVTPAATSVQLAKALDRSVTGSMNELIRYATALLADDELSVQEVGTRLNGVLLSSLARGGFEKYARPRDVFSELVSRAES